MSKRFEEKVIIVVGGGNGIGRAVSLQLAAEGAKVVVLGRSEENGLKTVELIKEVGEGIFVKGDASVEEDVMHLVETTLNIYGKIDGLYNNVGITGSRIPLLEHTVESFQKIMNTNTLSAFLTMKHIVPEMIKNGGGTVVNTASIAGLTGYPSLAPYSASKHAIIGLTKSVVGEYSKFNIRFNVVCPGPTFTETVQKEIGSALPPEHLEMAKQAMASKIPVGRLGEPENIAALGCFLLSDEASFVNGSIFTADGGITSF